MHFFRTAFVLAISVHWWFDVACVAASILFSESFGASTQNNHKKSARSPISNDHEHSFRISDSQVGLLEKRGNGPDLSLVYFEPGELLIPVQAAAEILETFYTSIAINSNGPWAGNTPRIWIRITFGAIRLIMTATEGTTIPWDFVTSFALEMLRLTERGYTGTYTANFVDPTVGNAIWVSLYRCVIGPLTDPAAIGAPAEVASCLNPWAQAWVPMRGIPMR